MSFSIVNAVQIFSGDVSSVDRKGRKLTAKCRLGRNIFDTQLPVFVKGISCSHLRGSPGDGSHLISQGCTGPDNIMLRNRWKFTAKVGVMVTIIGCMAKQIQKY